MRSWEAVAKKYPPGLVGEEGRGGGEEGREERKRCDEKKMGGRRGEKRENLNWTSQTGKEWNLYVARFCLVSSDHKRAIYI